MSVEDQRYGLPRIAQLQLAPAKVRFLSVEPMLEALGVVNLEGVSWVICGGESGPGARPIQQSWVTSLRDQCAVAGVPFFFKQWGGVRKSLTGRLLEGRTHDGYPPRGEGFRWPPEDREQQVARLAMKYGLTLPGTKRTLANAHTDAK